MEQKYQNRNLLEILQKLGISHKIWLANTNELIKFSILKYENDTGKKIAWGLDKWAVTEIINGSTIGIHYPERYMINYLKNDDWLAEFSGMTLYVPKSTL